jgi:hypothetical protein
MNFDDLYNLVVEAKGTKPGERVFNAQQAAGPSGFSSSPIGKSNYNPVNRDREGRRKTIDQYKGENLTDVMSLSSFASYDPNSHITPAHNPKDKGMTDQVNVIKLLGKSFQLLKNDDVFADQMKGIMKGFEKNRRQISAYQESIIKSKPKHVDNLWGRINRLITIVNDPKKQKDSDIGDFRDELTKFKGLRDEAQSELDDVYESIENVSQENEEINDSYLEQMLAVIRDTAKRLYKKQAEEILTTPEESPKRTIPLHELDINMIEKEVAKDAQTQLQLLEMLFSDNSDMNPLVLFLDMQKQNYDEYKNNFFEAKRGDNYSISIEQLYRSLPLFKMISYFYNVIMKSPAISLNMKQAKRAKTLGGGDDMIQRLEGVKNEKEWEEIRPDLLTYLKKQKIDKDRKKMLTDLAKGRFQAIRGRANAAIKLVTALKAAAITESFDELANAYAASFDVDINDFMIDLQEVAVFLEKSKKCDGPTKKASSDRKGKKWTKCARQPDGSYKRIHWGEAGVRVGKDNPKRRKSFRKRHNCKDAKPGSANALSCADW